MITTDNVLSSTRRARSVLWISLFACVGVAPFHWAHAQPTPPAPNSDYSIEHIGKPLLGTAPAPLELKVQYPKKVDALFDLTYATIPGYRPLTLDLYHVPVPGRRPAVVFVHGGSLLRGSPRAPTPLWGANDGLMAYIAAQGFVVAAISYRFASEALWPAQLEDTKAAIRWLRANADKYGIDPQHIAVWGESAGGGVAAMAGTTCGVAEFDGQGGNLEQSSCVQAAIDWYGVSDMNQLDAQAPPNSILVHNSPDSSQSKVLGCVLHYQCEASVVARANPITYVGAKTSSAAFLIMHGGGDRAVSSKQSQILYDALHAKGISAKLWIIPGVDHYFVGASVDQARQILDTVVGFLHETLATSSAAVESPAVGMAPAPSGTSGSGDPALLQKLTDAKPGDIRVFATAAFLGPLQAVRLQAQKAIGHPLVIQYGSARGSLRQQILAGDPFDVALLLPDVDNELLQTDRILPTRKVIAFAEVGIGVRGDASQVSISTPEALKQALLGAQSVRYAPTGAAHDTVAKLLSSLAIEDSIKDTSKADPSSRLSLSSGQYEIDLFPLSELVHMDGVRTLGPVLPQYQVPVTIEAVVAKGATDTKSAQKLVDFLRGPDIKAALQKYGMKQAP
jgi:acetyl esterase/lipase/ABC-type molybdate transport system substrate-binding protein